MVFYMAVYVIAMIFFCFNSRSRIMLPYHVIGEFGIRVAIEYQFLGY